MEDRVIRWVSILEAVDGPLVWVSFAQLYLHYQSVTKHPGNVKVGRKWQDPEDSPLVMPERFSYRVRARWFRMQLQQLWKDCGWSIKTCSTRPKSDILVCFLGSATLPIKSASLTLVENWLKARSKPIGGHGQALDSLPLAW